MNQTTPILGMHHVALRSSDFDKSLRFYCEGLGFTVACQWGEGDSRIAMLDMGNGDKIELFAGGHPCTIDEQGAGAYFHFAFRCADVQAVYDRALACGATSRVPPKEGKLPSNPPLPMAVAFVYGPDGETLEFFCPKEG